MLLFLATAASLRDEGDEGDEGFSDRQYVQTFLRPAAGANNIFASLQKIRVDSLLIPTPRNALATMCKYTLESVLL